MEIVTELQSRIGWLLGLNVDTLNAGHMLARAVVVYIATIIMVRVGEKRFLGKSTAFDVILGIILGSVVSRAINSSTEFFPTLAAGFFLVALHWTFAVIAFRSDRLGTLVKGSTRKLVKDGQILWGEMRSSHISKDDLLGALRLNGSTEDASRVESAWLERNGDISVLKQKRDPKVIEVKVEPGVQTIRIEVQ
jgi:uncharacterized membrane protein YcaP (DUF421 family)